MDGNYDYTKKKIPEDAGCDICDEAPSEGKRAPKWFIVSHKNRLTVRRKKLQERQARLNQIIISRTMLAQGFGKVKII